MQSQSQAWKSWSSVSHRIFVFIFDFWNIAFISIVLLIFLVLPEIFVHEASETFSAPPPLSWFCKLHVKTCAFQETHIAFMVKNRNISLSFFKVCKQPKISPRHLKLFRPAIQKGPQCYHLKKVKIQLLIFQMDLILRSERSARHMD